MSKKIYLGWAHSKQSDFKNFGDELSPYIINKLSGLDIFYIPVLVNSFHLLKLIIKRLVLLRFIQAHALIKILFGQRYLLSTGSVLQFYKFGNANVWGSGLIDSSEKAGSNNKYYAVRGPLTREILLNEGDLVPEIYGDPALILKRIYDKEINIKYDVGFIPHVIHYNTFISTYKFNSNVKVINLKTDKVEKVIDQIRSCKLILSSSLHGLIVAHAYNIPAIWVNISDEKLMGDNIKFADYFKSVGLSYYEALVIKKDDTIEEIINSIYSNFGENLCPNYVIVDSLIKGLLENTPFKKISEYI